MKKAKAKWIDSAKDDVRSIKAHIKKNSPKFAKVQEQRILDQVDQLEVFPSMGRRIEVGDEREFRYVIMGSYQIIYLVVSEQEIHIIRVWHMSKNFDPSRDLHS